MGTVKPNKDGINEVQSDFRLATAADIVADPSAPDAWVNGIMESMEWVYDERMGWKAIQIAEESKREIEHAVSARKLAESKMKLFENYLKKLSRIAN
jgi:hypothetical protein